MVEICVFVYAQDTKIFDPYDCIVFRLYTKLLSTHGPNLAYCGIFPNKLVS